MESILVYSLVVIFFVALAVFVATVVVNHPDTEPSESIQVVSSRTEAFSQIKETGAYILLAFILASLFVVAFLNDRKRMPAKKSS
jgi:hypothetical protein